MAVAAHVSRVAKDYAPHGYSIMAEASVQGTTPSSGTDDTLVTLSIIEDADIYIESITLHGYSEVTADNSNFLVFKVESFPSLGSGAVRHANQSTIAADLNGIAVDEIISLTVTNPVISSTAAKVLQFSIGKSLDHAYTNSKTVAVCVRYRRKA